MKSLLRILKDEKAATAVEYGLILALIVLAMFAALDNVANTTSNMWADVRNEVVGDEA
jgi:pilus assembly protein Flp/PilA